MAFDSQRMRAIDTVKNAAMPKNPITIVVSSPSAPSPATTANTIIKRTEAAIAVIKASHRSVAPLDEKPLGLDSPPLTNPYDT